MQVLIIFLHLSPPNLPRRQGCLAFFQNIKFADDVLFTDESFFQEILKMQTTILLYSMFISQRLSYSEKLYHIFKLHYWDMKCTELQWVKAVKERKRKGGKSWVWLASIFFLYGMISLVLVCYLLCVYVLPHYIIGSYLVFFFFFGCDGSAR